MEWSSQQSKALNSIQTWLNDPNRKQVFKLFGYAGSGKTTLARKVAEMVDGNVLYGAYTGKAAMVLRSKGCTGASTIHSMIYKVEDDEYGHPRFVLDGTSRVAAVKLVVIDEVSMVGDDLAIDLLRFKTPILVLGDPFQLPPIKGSGYFMGIPDFMLTEIHRQAQNNPIIKMSMDIREGKKLTQFIKRSQFDVGLLSTHDQVLVGLNKTRRGVNNRVRRILGIDSQFPIKNDRLVCLRNNKNTGVLNGSMWNVEWLERSGPGLINIGIKPFDAGMYETEVVVPEEFFTGNEDELDWKYKRQFDEFDFGYAITVHKSQGSQWNKVLLFDESESFREHAARWLYTGVTRAAEEITIVR